MAIHPDYPGLSVEIVVNDEPLKEFDDDGDPKPLTITKYVEAVSDANFGIQFSIEPGLHDKYGIELEYRLDGRSGGTEVIRNNKFHQKKYNSVCKGKDSYSNGSYILQKFRFSQLSLEDVGAEFKKTLEKQLKSVGQIKVKAFWIDNVRKKGTSASLSTPTFPEFGPLSEKAMKGRSISHHTKLDAPEPYTKFNSVTVDYVDGNDSPFAVFEFNYRSLATLKSLMVVPRTPSPAPPPSPVATPFEGMNRDELLNWIRYNQPDQMSRQIKREEESKIKRERPGEEEDHDGSDLEVVEERSSKRQRFPTEQDEVIILD